MVGRIPDVWHACQYKYVPEIGSSEGQGTALPRKLVTSRLQGSVRNFWPATQEFRTWPRPSCPPALPGGEGPRRKTNPLHGGDVRSLVSLAPSVAPLRFAGGMRSGR